jgi:hypothetical protein
MLLLSLQTLKIDFLLAVDRGIPCTEMWFYLNFVCKSYKGLSLYWWMIQKQHGDFMLRGLDILINQYKSIVGSFPDVGFGWGVGFSMLSFGGIFCPITQ